MTYLGDYLGQLLSEISMARMQGDVETLRLAELYAAHPLLRTMPVPHFRVPDVDVEIPVLIKASEEPRAGESTRGGAKLAEMRSTFDKVLSASLSSADITLSPANNKRLRTALDQRLSIHGLPSEVSIDVKRVADDLTATAAQVIGQLRPQPGGEVASSPTFVTALSEAVQLEFLKLRTAPPRLTVLVTSAELRESGTSENVTRLRLKVSEQGVEWKTIESQGTTRDRLVPE